MSGGYDNDYDSDCDYYDYDDDYIYADAGAFDLAVCLRRCTGKTKALTFLRTNSRLEQ